jgi:uncharacterized protein (TIGR03435 family)
MRKAIVSAQRRCLLASVLGVITYAPPIALGVGTVRPVAEPQHALAPLPSDSASDKAPPRFEVTSVRENHSGSRQSNFATTPGRVTATNVNLYQLISIAYNGAPMPMGTLEEAPNWAVSDKYDIIATTNSELSRDEFQMMMRALLVDRFRLRIHEESRQRPIYVLTLARTDGSTGPQLRRSGIECGNGAPTDGQRREAGNDSVQPCQLRTFPGKMTGRAVTLDMLVKTLVGAVADHREIRDQTGLDGRFDVDLEWTPDNAVVNLRPLDAPPLPEIDPNGPPLVTALREQLGLRLDAQKSDAKVWVIEYVERPKAN